jgi:hypothetical protein
VSFARHLAVATAAAALVLAGCGNTDNFGPGSAPDTAEQQDDTDAATDSADADTGVDDDAEEEGEAPDELVVDEEDASDVSWRYVEEFDEPFVWEENGVRLSITGVGLTDATSDEIPSDVAEFLEDGAQVVVVLEMTASNDSGQAIDFYPSQGTIQLLREQVEADFWFSDSFAGSEWRDGVDDSGQVFWQLTSTSYDDALQAGELTYTTSTVFSTEDFEEVAGGAEITVTWATP